MNWKRATYGVELFVPKPMEIDFEFPEAITEFTSRRIVRSHDENHPWPPKQVEVPGDLSDYRAHIDDVSESCKEEFLELARRTLGDENSEFKTSAIAAMILDQSGDQDAFASA